ncbi:hypothetical protein JBP901_gp070 [Bacillus phage JBP901]|uniref:Uncharacterized protein n=1 Tax=Bacillus phage JBP901 TaxID=1498212 RepID=A0A0E3DF83_9CAUD|nr:hypothetical protein JBP901_gp070 [Bacillus phage JBP901]AID17782.1 hypothetical protein JBP901_gp070 [Bacillus phage JBP901]
MEKYIKLPGDEPMKTPFEYEVGEVIMVNSNRPHKCWKKETVDGKMMQYFKEGKVQYTF